MSEIEEMIKKASEEKPFAETSEIGEVFSNLDNPKRINHNSRLRKHEISSLISIQSLTKMGIWDFEEFATQFKELAISEDGLGRIEKTQIASASRGADLQGRSGGGFLSGFMGMFKRRED